MLPRDGTRNLHHRKRIKGSTDVLDRCWTNDFCHGWEPSCFLPSKYSFQLVHNVQSWFEASKICKNGCKEVHKGKKMEEAILMLVATEADFNHVL